MSGDEFFFVCQWFPSIISTIAFFFILFTFNQSHNTPFNIYISLMPFFNHTK